jgi:hypothetical protein
MKENICGGKCGDGEHNNQPCDHDDDDDEDNDNFNYGDNGDCDDDNDGGRGDEGSRGGRGDGDGHGVDGRCCRWGGRQRERSHTRGFSLGGNGRSVASMAVGGGGGAELMR